jgi:hypothetical protein
MQLNACPVCQGKWSGTFLQIPASMDGAQIECTNCGRYKASRNAIDDFFNSAHSGISDRVRALTAHLIFNHQSKTNIPSLDSYWVEQLLAQPNYPTPAQQALNAIRKIGDAVNKTGDAWESLPDNFFVQIGSPNPRFAFSIVKELYNRGLVTGIPKEAMRSLGNFLNVSLSLAGWESYEQEHKGKSSSSYGFMALKFGIPELDRLLMDVLKPSTKELGFELLDMRDSARTGVIDNIMREKIRDCAFVIADLTHDNLGAYWEAGYAEGLGKPVLYLCEHGKFEISKTHFDTSHCTTVTWGGSKTKGDFAAELKATLRNSLGLFPTR